MAIEVGNTEWPKWEKVMSADPVDPVELEALARNAALTRPRPGHADLVGHAEVRLRRGPARSWSAPPPARPRPGSPWAGWPRNFLEQAVGARMVSPRRRARRGAAPRPASVPDARRRGAARRRPGALPGPRRPARRWWPRSTRPTRTATPSAASSRSSCHGLPPGPRLARALGPPARLAAGRRADGHPGDQGRRGRRRLRARGDPGLAGARRDRADRRRASAVRPAAPAAPRAG